MSGGAGEKTEKPTPKRRKEARKEGQVARSPELGPWLALAVLSLVLPALARGEIARVADLMERCLREARAAEIGRATALLAEAGRHVVVVLVALGSAVLLVSVAGSLAQGGFYLATKAVKPSAKKLDPLKGAKRILGPHAWWEGAKMLVKCSVVGLLVWSAVRAAMPLIGGFVPLGVVLSSAQGQVLALVRTVAVAGVALALVDYALQRRRTGKQTRMTKDEVKQEHKQAEGDPLVKGALRARRLAVLRNRMMQDVPTSDVVLTNPTHVAVALRYDPARGTPVVVARGAGVIAARIRELAVEHRVPIVQDVPLARALYRSTEVGHEIPAELFAAVAHVLAFVISRRNRGVRGGRHRSPRGEAVLPTVLPAGRRRAS